MTTEDHSIQMFCAVDDGMKAMPKHSQTKLFRQGRSPQQVGKGRLRDALCVSIKLCLLLNEQGQVAAWDWATMNVHDQHFHPVIKPLPGRPPSLMRGRKRAFLIVCILKADPFHMSIAEFSL